MCEIIIILEMRIPRHRRLSNVSKVTEYNSPEVVIQTYKNWSSVTTSDDRRLDQTPG